MVSILLWYRLRRQKMPRLCHFWLVLWLCATLAIPPHVMAETCTQRLNRCAGLHPTLGLGYIACAGPCLGRIQSALALSGVDHFEKFSELNQEDSVQAIIWAAVIAEIQESEGFDEAVPFLVDYLGAEWSESTRQRFVEPLIVLTLLEWRQLALESESKLASFEKLLFDLGQADRLYRATEPFRLVLLAHLSESLSPESAALYAKVVTQFSISEEDVAAAGELILGPAGAAEAEDSVLPVRKPKAISRNERK